MRREEISKFSLFSIFIVAFAYSVSFSSPLISAVYARSSDYPGRYSYYSCKRCYNCCPIYRNADNPCPKCYHMDSKCCHDLPLHGVYSGVSACYNVNPCRRCYFYQYYGPDQDGYWPSKRTMTYWDSLTKPRY